MEEQSLKDRIGRIFLECKNVEKIVIANTGSVDPNFLYMTGFTSGLFEYSYLLLDRSSVTLFTSGLEYRNAKEQAPDNMDVVQIKSAEELDKTFYGIINGKIIGLNGSFLPYKAYLSVKEKLKPKEVVDVSSAFAKIRLIKSEDEVKAVRKAASITKWAMLLIQKEFKKGMTEVELASVFDNISARLGSQGPSFKTIVCFGKNAAYPHHFPDETKLKYGDIVLVDAGAKVDNYSSDITRTFIFGESKDIPDYDRKEEVYRIVKDAQLKAIKKIKPGLKGKDIHKIAADHIDNAEGGKYKGTFIHSLGHSVGIEVHDGPGFAPNGEQVLEPGMVITVEPGIYIPGFGGVRIEDDVLITKNGAAVL